jgi:hypothetical protein
VAIEDPHQSSDTNVSELFASAERVPVQEYRGIVPKIKTATVDDALFMKLAWSIR